MLLKVALDETKCAVFQRRGVEAVGWREEDDAAELIDMLSTPGLKQDDSSGADSSGSGGGSGGESSGGSGGGGSGSDRPGGNGGSGGSGCA